METSLSLTKTEKHAFVTKTYGWMAVALLLSAAAAFYTSTNEALLRVLFMNRAIGFWVLCIAEILLVVVLTAKIRTMSVMTALAGFVAYSIMDGVTLSSIFLVYKLDSIAAAFLGTSAMFGLMSFYGLTTKKDLNSIGHYCMMGLIGIIISGAVQFVISIFSHADFSMFNMLISVATVIVFTGLTAYDAQKIIKTASYAKENDDYKKVSILAALELYLDFINLFLALLRIFGKRK